MADKPFPFIGGSYSSAALNLDAQRSMNVFAETDETGEGKNKAALYGTPGLSPFCLLPTSPVRGMLATDANRLFVVAGAIYYEISTIGVYTAIGNVGDDAAHSPVQIIANGTQVMIVSAGLVWIDDGVSLEQANFQNGSGTVTTSGTAVTWISGSEFDSSNVGNPIIIAGSPFTVASVTDDTHLVLTSSAGSHGTTVSGTCSTAGTAVTWVSGGAFDPAWLPAPGVITINGVVYTLSDVTSGTALDLTATAGTQTAVAFSVTIGVAYSATYPVTASWGAFLDGYYIVSQPGTKTFNISAINDGKSWNPLDFGKKEGQPDGILSLLGDHEELWIFGSQTIEVWNDTGAATFPLARNPSGFIPTGCLAPASATRVAGSVAWIGGDSRGGPFAYMANGFIPVRVSTLAIEAVWATYGNVFTAISYAYSDGGHQFWVINFPAANATWVYDLTEKEWHERGFWNGSSWDMQRQTTHAFFNNFATYQHLVGDHVTGQIYGMAMSLLDDAGTAIHRFRSAPHIANRTLWQYYTQFTLDVQVGSGGANLALDYSDDGGVTWNTPRVASVFGTSGSRVLWRRLGRSRDRVFRVSYSGFNRVAWINAHLDSAEGTT